MTLPHMPPEVGASFERRIEGASVPASKRSEYHQWVRFYLYFCQKLGYPDRRRILSTPPAAL